ncbi:hypothetical protein IE53DRAFT_380124 [Violaceomyces palustris]|uniref:Uncharacterized protein n=1 Tax=Violaceomyces palustris TaxID=1673888 RepID=A0ACD0NW24_9BASI|nr:hypothetical protein IE53DRAFT_380124 [Violaceomyces palustris]
MQPSSWTGLVRRQLSPQAVTGVTDSIGQGGKKAGDAIKQSAAKLSTTQLIMVVVFSLLLFAGSILASVEARQASEEDWSFPRP